jgi:hypothetical protein
MKGETKSGVSTISLERLQYIRWVIADPTQKTEAKYQVNERRAVCCVAVVKIRNLQVTPRTTCQLAKFSVTHFLRPQPSTFLISIVSDCFGTLSVSLGMRASSSVISRNCVALTISERYVITLCEGGFTALSYFRFLLP